MKSLSLYEDKQSFLNGLTPGCKALYIIAALIIPAMLGNELVSVGFIILSILLLVQSKVIRKTLPILAVSGFVLLTVVIIQGMFRDGNETVVLVLGPIVFYKEGLLFASSIVINVFNIIFSFCVLVLTTKPSDMIESMVQRGFSPRVGYVFVSLFQLIPQMTERMSTITDAQRSRGMETEGSLLVRVKAFIPLISPVIMSSLIDTKERAIALEVRGFNSKEKKSFLNVFHANRASRPIFWMLLLATVASVAMKIVITFA